MFCGLYLSISPVSLIQDLLLRRYCYIHVCVVQDSCGYLDVLHMHGDHLHSGPSVSGGNQTKGYLENSRINT